MTVKVLLIVEGKKTEKEFFSQMFNEWCCSRYFCSVYEYLFTVFKNETL